MAKKSWAPCPIKDKAFDYSGDKLAKAWPKLHAGDQEPFPDETHVDVLLKANPKLGKDAAAIAADLQEAWRDFHRGEFQRAYESGLARKALGASVAIKAAGIMQVASSMIRPVSLRATRIWFAWLRKP